MSNVIALTFPPRHRPLDARLAALAVCFCEKRRFGDDVFWLKENAEFLNILETSGLALPDAGLDPYLAFYEQVWDRLVFFPQYYRFLLSIALDLEDLGLPGDLGERLVSFAAEKGLAEAELSDLQRAEARRLMARRGHAALAWDESLADRLRRFAARPGTFALPNKKAAYELTHIFFYLSEYGRRDPDLPEAAFTSLIFAGILAFLDQNADLLAEVCIALRFAGRTPPPAWEDWIERDADAFDVFEDPAAQVQDGYHDYFVINWHRAIRGQAAFGIAPGANRATFARRAQARGPLRAMSEAIFRLGPRRSGDWETMRDTVSGALDFPGQDVLCAAEKSVNNFDVFFHDFSRAMCHAVPGKEAVV